MKITSRKIRVGLLLVVVIGSGVLYWKLQEDVEECASCLPAKISLSSTMYQPRFHWVPAPEDPGTRVRTKLFWLGAFCKNGQIYDRWGTPVLFQQIYCSDVTGLDGIPQSQHQERELENLRKQFTVITYGSFKD